MSGTGSNNIDSNDFSTFTLDDKALRSAALEILGRCGPAESGISQSSLDALVTDIQSKYQTNPFHCFAHALSVTQMMHLFITQTKLQSILNPKEKFTLLLCMLCHDLQHPGLSNGFQINSRSALAKLYNNTSVLENHHLSCTLELLQEHDDSSDIFAAFTPDEKSNLYGQLTTLILSTDLAKHFALLKDFERVVDNFQWENPVHREQLFIMLVKAADISNEARPFPLSQKWADALMNEYFAQSDLEKTRSLPVTPFMDREKVVLPQTQVNFIDSLLLPTFALLHKALPEIQQHVDAINANKKSWAELGKPTPTRT